MKKHVIFINTSVCFVLIVFLCSVLQVHAMESTSSVEQTYSFTLTYGYPRSLSDDVSFCGGDVDFKSYAILYDSGDEQIKVSCFLVGVSSELFKGSFKSHSSLDFFPYSNAHYDSAHGVYYYTYDISFSCSGDLSYNNFVGFPNLELVRVDESFTSSDRQEYLNKIFDEYVENGGIDWEEKLPVYDASLPYITNLQYDSLTGSACHNESTLNGCFRLAWDVPFGVTEDDALDIRVAADYNYATDISTDRQFSSCFLNLTDIYGYIPISDSPFKFCVKDFIPYVDTSDSHFGFNSSEVYGFTFVPKRIYIRIVRNSSDGSFFGDWVIYDVNRDVLNRPQVGLGQIVPGDTEIDDSGDFVYPSSDTVTLNDFFLSNVKLVKESVVSNVGYYKITWNGTTRSSDLVFIPDSDTAVIAVIILTDSFGNISNKTVATTTIGKGFFRFNIDELLDYEDESSLYWDGFIYVMPTFKRNGDLYMGQYSVVNALNGDIYQDTIDESDGSLHRELVSSENTAAVSGSFSSSLIDYVNEGFNFLNSLVVMMKDFPALVAAVFQFIPSVYINAIGVMLIIMLIARILGR